MLRDRGTKGQTRSWKLDLIASRADRYLRLLINNEKYELTPGHSRLQGVVPDLSRSWRRGQGLQHGDLGRDSFNVGLSIA